MLRNISSNVVGTVLPSLSALLAVPLLLDRLGMGGFGVFSMQVAALFFFGLSDLGISRAIVLLSFDEKFAAGQGWWRPYQVGLRFSVALGALVTALAVPVGAGLWHWQPTQVPPLDLTLSTVLVFLCAGLTLLMQAPRAVLESQERFVTANAIRGPAAAAIFLAPLVALEIDRSLTSAAISLLLTRIVAALAYFWAAGHASESRLRPPLDPADRPALQAAFLLKAGWLGMTNVLSMLLAYADRFVLGALGSTVMVGQYVIAQEVVTKAWISSGAIISAGTPRLAAARRAEQAAGLQQVARQMALWMVAAGVLPALVLVLLGGWLLQLWLGKNFDAGSVLPLQLMAVGLGVNTLAQVNFTLVQVQGGERHGAFLQVFNLGLLAIGLLLLVPRWGATGAAATFTVRLLLDAAAGRWLLDRVSGGARVGIGALWLVAVAVVLAGCLLLQRLLLS